MKNLTLKIAFVLALGVVFNSNAQSNNYLYAGSPYWETNGGNLRVLDTTGGVFTTIADRPLTCTEGVSGIYGLAFDDNSGTMYVLYHNSGSSTRRLGTIDTLTAVITDIGLMGGFNDIEFGSDGVLYASGNSQGVYGLYSVDLTTAATTSIPTGNGATQGGALGFNSFNDKMYYFDNNSTNATTYDIPSLTESSLAPVNPFGQDVTYLEMINDSIMYVGNWNNLYLYNTNTNAFSSSTYTTTSYHGMSFGYGGLAVVTSGPRTYCSNATPTVLSLTESGTVYQWYMDGAIIPSETNPTYTPISSGDYHCIMDAKVSSTVTITILDAPTTSFTVNPNPVDLTVDPAGMAMFTNTTTGTGDVYFWDFDNGITSTNENVYLSLSTNNGSFDVSYSVTNSTTGCTDTHVETINVINALGVDELMANVSVYPNPAKDIVTIESNNGDYNAAIIDINGKSLKSFNIVGGKANTIDVANYEAGIYLIKVEQNGKTGYIRLVKD